MPIREYDVVRLKHDREGVPAGSLGTVLIVYQDGRAFGVEFHGPDGWSIAFLTLDAEDVELEDRSEPPS